MLSKRLSSFLYHTSKKIHSFNRSFATKTESKVIQNWRREYTDGPLTPLQIEQFWRDGFTIKHNVFSRDALQPTIKSLEFLVDQLAEKLHSSGRIKDKCKNASFYERLSLLEKQFPGACVLIHKQGVLPDAISSIWSNETLLDIAQQIVGPNIGGHPVWNIRTKVPRTEQVTVPWHQDSAYLQPSSWDVLQLTAWIPLIDANLENGCMQIARGGHRSGKVAQHKCCVGNTWYVELDEKNMMSELDVDMNKDIVTCEVPMGSVLFLNNLVPHRSLENYSENIRWSLDLRWQDPAKDNGFYGLKPNIPLRMQGQPNYTPDWTKWANTSRTELQKAAATTSVKEVDQKFATNYHSQQSQADFDTTISGPWMKQWEIVHHNKHTRAMDSQNIITKA